MFKRIPSARTKADKRYAADCSNVQPHYWQYSCWAHTLLLVNKDGVQVFIIHTLLSTKLFSLFLTVTLTDNFIEELINCSKSVVDAPKEMKEGRSGFTKRTFTLVSTDGQYNFNGFITQNLTFIENFSIGLSYNLKEEKGKIVLLRCNGPHGGTINIPHHASCHIHKSTAERINSGLKPEGQIEITTEYATIEEAIQFFVRRINLNVADRQMFFPPPSGQIDLFGEIEEKI